MSGDLVAELARWSEEYVAAFSTKSATAAIAFYKQDACITFHQLGADRSGGAGTARDLSAYTGSTFGALRRRLIPGRLMLWVLFRRLAKRNYDRSTIAIRAVRRRSVTSVDVLLTFERLDRTGHVFESSAAVYRLDRTSSSWAIAEAWLFDSIDAPPRGLDLQGFQPT